MSLVNESFYSTKEDPTKSCLITLRDIILNQDKNIVETQKYGMPCFCFKNKMFCYLWTDKKNGEPYILFVEGKHLNHPELEPGSRSRMKIFRVNVDKDLPIKKIKLLLNEAIDFYKNDTLTITNTIQK